MSHDDRAALSVLVVGESWIRHIVHLKGFDQFHSTEYQEGASVFLAGLSESGFDVTYIRAHEISSRFPTTAAEFDAFDVVVLSDVGANSFLLCDETFLRSDPSVNRLSLLGDYVRRGGGLVMVGGYMSFSGIDGRARYTMSPLASILPVEMLHYDDRIERPEGVRPVVSVPEHEAVGGIVSAWPMLLGYNKVAAKADSTVIAEVGEDPLLVVGHVGNGRAAAFTSDLAPHWAPSEFVEWSHYRHLWASIIGWVGNGRVERSSRELAAATV